MVIDTRPLPELIVLWRWLNLRDRSAPEQIEAGLAPPP
jgi:hypothetical protein